MNKADQGPSRLPQGLKTQGGRLLKWVVGLVGSVIGIIVVAIVTPIGGQVAHRLFPESPDISVFDVAFLPGELPYDGALDVRVENTGNQVAYLTGMQVRVVRTWEIKPSVLGRPRSSVHQPSTYTYTYELPPPGFSGTDVGVPVSQTLRPGETDRFSLALKNDLLNHGGPSSNVFVYLLAVRADYNGATTPERRLLSAAVSRGSTVPFYAIGPGNTPTVTAHNRAILQDIRRFGAVEGPYLRIVVAAVKG